jgi:hypothetical protein
VCLFRWHQGLEKLQEGLFGNKPITPDFASGHHIGIGVGAELAQGRCSGISVFVNEDARPQQAGANGFQIHQFRRRTRGAPLPVVRSFRHISQMPLRAQSNTVDHEREIWLQQVQSHCGINGIFANHSLRELNHRSPAIFVRSQVKFLKPVLHLWLL